MGSAAGSRKAAATRAGISLAEYDALLLSGHKWCHPCREWHKREAFGVDAARADGLNARCLASRAETASRVRTTSGPGRTERRRAAEQGQAWCRDCCAWQPLDEVKSGQCRAHRNLTYRAHYAVAGEPIRQRAHARRRGLDLVPVWWIEERRDLFGGQCAYGCGRLANTTDHIWPVARGGTSCPGNLVPACRSCNSAKRDRHPQPWFERGLRAFPDPWGDLVALALEHNTDQWLETA